MKHVRAHRKDGYVGVDIPRVSVAVGAGLLVAPTSLLAQGGSGPEANLFGINLGLAFWTVLVFLLLLVVLRKIAWKPMLGALDARTARIQDALDESAEKRAEAQRLLEEHKKQLADARRQAQEIIQEGKEAGEKVRREIEEKAREEGQTLLERARREIEREKDAALQELRRESVDLALAAAARLMGERMDQERDRELVMDFVDRLGGGTERTRAAGDEAEA